MPLARGFAAVTQNVPSMGDSITSGKILEWKKNVGDSVKVDDILVSIETDKVAVDVPASVSGTLTKQFAAKDTVVEVGKPLLEISEGAVAAAAAPAPKPAPAPAAAASSGPKKVFKQAVPSMGDSITSGKIIEWKKKVGDSVAVDEAVVVIETEKVAVEVPSPVAGVLTKTFAALDAVVEVGAPLLEIEEGVAAQAAPKAAAPTAAAPAPAAAPEKKAAPAEAAKKPSGPAPAAAKPPVPAGSRTETRVAMSTMRQRIAQRLKESQNTNAMLTTFQEVDMSAVIALRNKYKDSFEKTHGVKLGFMSAFAKAAAAALQEIPAVNAVIDGGDIVYRNYVDISVAVASPRGLVVPVVRNVEGLSFADVEKTLADLANKARTNAITIEDMVGGTFTISNGGVFGSLMGTPIINPPQSAILGMHATKPRPVAVDGKVEIRPMMYLALTYDHRLIDGREAVTFLCSIRDKIEDPARLLLNL